MNHLNGVTFVILLVSLLLASRVGRRVGIGAHFQPAETVGPPHEAIEVLRELRLAHRHAALDDLAGRAVDGDDVALAEGLAAGVEFAGPGVDADLAQVEAAGATYEVIG